MKTVYVLAAVALAAYLFARYQGRKAAAIDGHGIAL